MPIYEFVCQNCGNEFELIRSFSDNSTPICPHCANERVDRQVGRPAIHFKGSGWYINDSKKASKSSANGKDGGNEGSNEGNGADGSADKTGEDKPKKTTAGAAGTKNKGKGESTTKSAAKQ